MKSDVTGKLSAEPTKEFFIHMLTRDIPLERAIIDLIDNSVDAAKEAINENISIRQFSDFEIKIDFNNSFFSIKDNCGGFSLQAAKEYAFKFGRPTSINLSETGSVGRFGVGMKRALFKIGNKFSVESKCGPDHFVVEENVNTWSKSQGKWEFSFREITGKSGPTNTSMLNVNGTFIKVTLLNSSVKQEFESKIFEKKLIDEIEKTLNYSLQSGIVIIVNGNTLRFNPIQLLVGENLKPYYLNETFNDVNVKIYAGIGEPDPNLAGWYIYCNERLMVEKDKSNLTGWEGGKNYYDDTGVQKFHNKVAMFRGLVFFTAKNPELLPMTTTKTGIDVNSTIYKSVREKMISAMKLVLADLNSLDNAEQRQIIVQNSKPLDVVSTKSSEFTNRFVFPTVKKTNFKDDKSNISYRVEISILKKVKAVLKVTSNTQVGEETFNYYVKMKEIE